MTGWIDPNLLAMVGLGLHGDADAPDGRHLRWFFGAPLGFPRSGFRLRRQPSKIHAAWDAVPVDPLIRPQATALADLGTSASHRFASGLTVGKRGGFVYESALGGRNPPLRIDAQPVTLDFGPAGDPPVALGPALSNPAAFVRLTVRRRALTGKLGATGSYDARGEYRAQDRGGLAALRVRSAAEASDPNPWLVETLLLRGGLLDHVEITGIDAALSQVQWITVRDYASDKNWVDVDRFYLPLVDAAPAYPAWTSLPADAVVKQRLALAPPRQRAPWDDPARSVDDNLALRYRGDALVAVDDALRRVVKRELDATIPQAQVEVTEHLEGGSDAVDAVVRPFEHVYSAAADPQVARLLGLMTTDLVDPAGAYDYLLDASFPGVWIRRALFHTDDKVTPGEILDGLEPCLAMVTAITAQAAASPEPPGDLRAEVQPDVAHAPIQARVELSWAVDRRNSYESAGRTRVLYALSRSDGASEVLLHHRDDDSKLVLPHAPTERTPTDGRLHLIDRTIPAWASYVWKLRGMDLWGRWSAPAEVTADVRDTIPPPAPTAIVATLDGDAAAAPAWSLHVAFDWSAGAMAIAADLARFELHLRQGEVARGDDNAPAAWGHFEHAPGAVAPPIIVRWPALTLDAVPPGLGATISATPIAAAEGGGQRLALQIDAIHAPFLATSATVSVAVRAIDSADNVGRFGAHAQARRFAESPAPPPMLPEDVQLASRPDALGVSSFTVRWPDLGGGRVRVLRASARALLAAAGHAPAAYDALDRIGKAALLRTLATAQRQVFAADHEAPYAATAGEHRSRLNAHERGLTVLTVEPTSATGLRAPWPSDVRAFVVVAVPALRPPRPPLVREIRAGDRQVTLVIAPDLTGETAELRVFRTRDAAALGDLRRMRLVARPLPAIDDTSILDSALFAEVDYWYRVVALAADGAPSAPSEPLRARPYSVLPPPSPIVTGVVRSAALRQITCVVQRRDYRLSLFRRIRGQVDWHAASGPHVEAGAIDVAALAPAPVSGGYQLVVTDDPSPRPDERYLYFVRVRDGQGRTTDSAAVEESP